ncbi:hypothetical protein [Longimicrobium terrae]|uniref:Type 4a pilus biogenesis protein PilO n=1 Tax=Longimicrobium terrae TaxID=1639882 RepID=A0A841GXH0_9BACT|nr:hypothetical protein [Longimicrobium terrae]MBB4635990.1 hypothetical protein [Longimicrobium terrae]MBB6070386.1 hypothetical protein [Longimicrobium terrae]NNC30882.1 hypothetical protein [Longimicrobium terrae]
MTRPASLAPRIRTVLLLVVLGAAAGAARWAVQLRPRAESLGVGRAALDADRRRLADTRAELLRRGPEGIAAKNRVLRSEVERREALAPAGSGDAAALEVRERFARLAARYGVHAPSFEAVPAQRLGELEIGGVRIRAAGGYHALGTWITEGLSDGRLLDVGQARLAAVPDSLTATLRAAGAAAGGSPPAAPGAGAPPAPGVPPLPGAQPLDAVVEFVVRWYALQAPGAGASSLEAR